MPPSALARLARPAGSPLIGPRIQAALGAVATLATIGLSQGSAQAYVVSVGGVQYDVTQFTGDYNSNINKFETAANGGVMPWFGSQSQAASFAIALGGALGYSAENNIGENPPQTNGPFFAWAANSSTVFAYSGAAALVSLTLPLGRTDSLVWAQANQVQAPGPLPILGAAAAFGASRKLRRRMKAIKVVASTATAV
jgi:hypothetical protein